MYISRPRVLAEETSIQTLKTTCNDMVLAPPALTPCNHNDPDFDSRSSPSQAA